MASADTERSVGRVSPAAISAQVLRRAAVAGAIGSGVVGWFDVAVYAYMAVIVGAEFFPSSNPTISLLSAFAICAAAFAVRPPGGVLFGLIGDRRGRHQVLV